MTGLPETLSAPRLRTSPWAVASMLCSAAVFCPLATLLGPTLGVKALADIRSRPGLKGTRLALAGIIIGLFATFAWIGVAMWWDRAVRQPILDGPLPELVAGFHGNIAGFQQGFYGLGSELPQADAIAFINELTRRYGQFHTMQQAPLAADAEPMAQGPIDPRIEYVLEFERGMVTARAEFVIFPDEGAGIVGKWRSIEILDDDLGRLVYPPESSR